MKHAALFSTLALTTLLSGAAIAAEQQPTSNWLPISQLASQLEQQGFKPIYEIERGKSAYKVKAVNAQGEFSKLRVNGETGEIMEQKQPQQQQGMKKIRHKHGQHQHHCNMNKEQGDN